MAFLSTLFSQIINGLQSGSIYALVALGYSMVYGIIMLLNFAHGDIIMVGAYVVWLSMTSFGLHPLFSILLAVAVSTLLGVVIEKVDVYKRQGLYRLLQPLRGAGGPL